jgi:hypothetical protein
MDANPNFIRTNGPKAKEIPGDLLVWPRTIKDNGVG